MPWGSQEEVLRSGCEDAGEGTGVEGMHSAQCAVHCACLHCDKDRHPAPTDSDAAVRCAYGTAPGRIRMDQSGGYRTLAHTRLTPRRTIGPNIARIPRNCAAPSCWTRKHHAFLPLCRVTRKDSHHRVKPASTIHPFLTCFATQALPISLTVSPSWKPETAGARELECRGAGGAGNTGRWGNAI
jgi:hypothetical protein